MLYGCVLVYRPELAKSIQEQHFKSKISTRHAHQCVCGVGWAGRLTLSYVYTKTKSEKMN